MTSLPPPLTINTLSNPSVSTSRNSMSGGRSVKTNMATIVLVVVYRAEPCVCPPRWHILEVVITTDHNTPQTPYEVCGGLFRCGKAQVYPCLGGGGGGGGGG